MGFFDFGSGIIASAIEGKPEMPKLPRIDLADMQGDAISANQAAMPAAQALASGVNKFNQEQIDQMLRHAIPQYDDLTKGVSANIDKMMSGQLPLSDQNQQQLRSVAQSFSGGFAGSPAMGNLVARDLGIAELNLVGKGMSAAESWLRNMGQLYQPGMMDLTSMFVSPMQMYETSNQQNLQQFQRGWASNLNDWEHSLGRATANEIREASSQFNSMVGSMVGKFGGAMLGGI